MDRWTREVRIEPGRPKNWCQLGLLTLTSASQPLCHSNQTFTGMYRRRGTNKSIDSENCLPMATSPVAKARQDLSRHPRCGMGASSGKQEHRLEEEPINRAGASSSTHHVPWSFPEMFRCGSQTLGDPHPAWVPPRARSAGGALLSILSPYYMGISYPGNTRPSPYRHICKLCA